MSSFTQHAAKGAQSARNTQHVSRLTPHVSRLTPLLFLAALLPRLYALGSFLTIDEVKWAEGAAQFLMALRSGDLAQTYWHFFPGITIAWGGAAALWVRCLAAVDLAECVRISVIHLPDSIGWLRLAPVLFTSLGIVAAYLLARRLLSEWAALLGALLLAFDPFFIAHSRILNGDAVAAILMFLSLLAFLSYQSSESAHQRISESAIHNSQFTIHNSLLISGILAGLAVLTKLPAPIIGGFIGGLGGIAALGSGRAEGWPGVRRWMITLLLWGTISLAAIWLLWPALWVAPIQTLQQMYADAFQVGGAGTGHDTYYLGQIVDDPGPWFYPHAIAFRLTPVTMMGLALIIAWFLVYITFYVLRFTNSFWMLDLPASSAKTAWILLLYVVFVILLANASPKKLDRYVMAVIPSLIFLAALGWTQTVEFALSRLGREGQKWPLVQPLLLGGLIALQLVFAILAAPYYLTYYNPLLGGVQAAARQVPVGWGEGLEQAAHYLNALPDAQNLSVSSWYGDMFEPYFAGRRASFADDGRAQLAADYVVFYVNQIQRQKPYPGLVDYFRSTQPAFVMRVGSQGQVSRQDGPAWVEVYRAPAAQSAGGAPKIEGVAQLLAYKVTGQRVIGEEAKDSPVPTSTNEIRVTLFFKVLGPLPDKSTFAASLNPITNNHLPIPSTLQPLIQHRGDWREGSVVEWQGIFTLPPQTPPGEYRLRVELGADTGTIAEFAISEKDPPVRLK
ncbi:MAG: phospholipid carrier-dependent glycosyltransferase [Anaerolineae bacterium]